MITTLIASGAYWFGSRVVRAKTTATRTILEADVDSIISWSAANGRLPTATEFNNNNLVKNPNDAWGKNLVYLYDGTMSSISTGLCGVTSTAYQNGGVNIAFIIVSGGQDYKVDSTPNASQAFPAGGTSLSTDDIVRMVPLEEVKSKAGCYGSTGGRLMIINDELPRVCPGTNYNGALFAAGGVPPRTWTFTSPPSWLSCNGGSCSGSFTGSVTLGGTSPLLPSGYPYSVQVQLQDSQSPANTITKTLYINYSTSASCPGSGGGINMTQNNLPPDPNGNTSPSSQQMAQNIPVSGGGGATVIAVQNNVIEFGFNVGNGAACVWYPYNFPLLGKTLRAFWNFCFSNIDTSADSTAYGDGYTFALMQANNPTTFCGTGNNDAAETPYDCQYGGALGEFLSYCGLPGYNMAAEFDIYPNSGRGDPTGYYNHVAVVKSLNTHTGPPRAGTYGDNTHGVWGNPACGTTLNPACNGTCAGPGAKCTGTCNGVSINHAACNGTCYGTCAGGTCDAFGLGCVFNNVDGRGHTYPITWMEQEGCNASYSNHNARVELHTRCNSTCSSCETASCTSTALFKIWIDGGNNNLTADETSAPDLAYCFTLPPAMDQVKVGFTEGTGTANQLGYIANFAANFFGSCPRPAITATSLPRISSGTPWTATFNATGGTPPYTWSWSSANLTNPNPPPAIISSSTLPAGCTSSSINSSTGAISCTPTSAGPYNTVLVSVKDSCTADACDNTVSMNLSPTCALTANPATVSYNTPATLTWTITNGPANGAWATAPGGNCANFNNSTGGSCTTGNITATTAYPLTVTNDFGTGTCSTTVNICSYSINPTSASVGQGGATGNTVSVAAAGGCNWTATSNNAWITITSGSNGSGNGTVTYNVAANAGGARSGSMTIAGQTFTVNQAGVVPPPSCTFTGTPYVVFYGNPAPFAWTIANGPADGSWSPSPGGTCGNFSNSSGGSCATANLTNTNNQTYTLTVTANGQNGACPITCTYYTFFGFQFYLCQ